MNYLNKKNFLSAYSRFLFVAKAWRTNKKIVVIESDDWGSIRTSNKDAYDYLSSKGYNMNSSPYTLDALEANKDLEELYNVLLANTDAQNNPACITANMIMANPDFIKIRENNYNTYYYETVEETLKRYCDREKVKSLWAEGNQKNIFYPQLHAREHIRYWEWIKDLKNSCNESIETFNLEMCGVPLKVSKEGKSYYKPLFIDDSVFIKEEIDLSELLNDAFALFRKEFGFNSLSTVAPNVSWTDSTEKIWATNQIKYIQGGYLQQHHFNTSIKYYPHFLGQKSKFSKMTYLVRNCTFEPATSGKTDYWMSTLKQIDRAFKLRTPAIISSHRVNFIGSIKAENRDNSLSQFSLLLKQIKKRWPDVLFINSVQLGDLISNSVKR